MYYDDSSKKRALGILAAMTGLIAVVIGLVFYGPQYSLVNPFASTGAKLPIEDPKYLYTVAQKSVHDGDDSYATGILHRILMIDRNNIDSRKLLAAISIRHQNYGEAITQCKGVLGLRPWDATARLGLARCYLETHKLDKAREVLRDLVLDKRCTPTERSTAASALEATGETVPPGAFTPSSASPAPADPVNAALMSPSMVASPEPLLPSPPPESTDAPAAPPVVR